MLDMYYGLMMVSGSGDTQCWFHSWCTNKWSKIMCGIQCVFEGDIMLVMLLCQAYHHLCVMTCNVYNIVRLQIVARSMVNRRLIHVGSCTKRQFLRFLHSNTHSTTFALWHVRLVFTAVLKWILSWRRPRVYWFQVGGEFNVDRICCICTMGQFSHSDLTGTADQIG